MTDPFGLPYKTEAILHEYDEGLVPGVDEPSRSSVQEFWHEANGTLVTDDARIAELEAGVKKLEEAYAKQGS